MPRRKPAYLQADLPGEVGRKQMRGLQKQAATEMYPRIPGRPREAQAEDLMRRTRQAQGERFLEQPPGVMDRLQEFGANYIEPMFMPMDPETGMPNVDLGATGTVSMKALREIRAKALNPETIHDVINARDVLFHRTPSLAHVSKAIQKESIGSPSLYTSLSRHPSPLSDRAVSKPPGWTARPIQYVIDREAVRTRPFAEPYYSKPSGRFEFEERVGKVGGEPPSFQQSSEIPMESVREIRANMGADLDRSEVAEVERLAKEAGIPFEYGTATPTYRARIGQRRKR